MHTTKESGLEEGLTSGRYDTEEGLSKTTTHVYLPTMFKEKAL